MRAEAKQIKLHIEFSHVLYSHSEDRGDQHHGQRPREKNMQENTENGKHTGPIKWYHYFPNVRYFPLKEASEESSQCVNKRAISMERKGKISFN